MKLIIKIHLHFFLSFSFELLLFDIGRLSQDELVKLHPRPVADAVVDPREEKAGAAGG